MSAKPPQSIPQTSNAISYTSQARKDPALQDLDAHIQRVSDKLLPPSPYLLTVPTRRPFHLDDGQREDWVKGTPFSAKEAELQYLSFLPNWEGIMRPMGGLLDDRGELIDPEKEKRKSASQTPKVAAKKISLAEYKQRKPGNAPLNANGMNGVPKPAPTVEAKAPATNSEGTSNAKQRKR